MKSFLREILWVALATFVSWWCFLRPSGIQAAEPEFLPVPIPLTLTPILEQRPEAELAALEITDEAVEEQNAVEPERPAEPEPEPEPPAESEQADGSEEPVVEEEPAEAPPADESPPPSELGTPEGAEDLEVAALAEEPEGEAAAAEEPEDSVHTLMEDPELLALAGAEISGEASRGFVTALIASPGEQLEIARLFGEELVLVPRSALDPEARNRTWFRIVGDGSGRVERMTTPPPLESYRQYRDLFDYEYGRLPASLRELRRSVLARNEIYLFAALIPAREWAVIIARRTEALADSGRELADVRRFVLRYVSTPEGGFDLDVEDILFADGSRFRPGIDLENSD